MRSATDQLFEPLLEQPSRLRNSFEHVGDINAAMGMLADIMDGAGNVPVADRKDVSGLPGADPHGRDQVSFAPNFEATHHFVEQRGGFVAGAVGVWNDA